jgi:drug/metabolite transporter (DMT)-like permease
MPLVAWYWLSEAMQRLVLLAVGFGFFGVILVLHPEGEFSQAALVGLFGGVLAAIAKVSIRRLGRTEPSVRVVFYFSLMATLISSNVLFWNWQTPTPNQWGLLILMGLFGTTGQLLLTRGYAIAAAASVSPFTYFSVIFGAVYGYLFWDEGLTLQFVFGALIIAVAGVLSIWSKLPQSPVAISGMDRDVTER